MWEILGKILSGGLASILTPITGMVTAIFNKKEDTNLEKFKVDGAVDTELVKAQVTIFQAQADLAKTKVMQFLYLIFSLPLAFHLGKVYIWDADLHLGTSDAVRGDVATWAGMIIGFIFFHSALSNWTRKT